MDFKGNVLKQRVQREVTGVENCVRWYIMAWDCGAGYFFVLIWSRHLVHSVFPFPLTTTQRISKWKNNRQCATICINIGGSLHPAPVGNAPRTKLVFADFLGSWRMADWRRINRGAKRLGLHKEQKILWSSLPFILHLAYYWSCIGRKRKKIPYKMEVQWKDKRASSTTVPSYFLSYEPTLDPPHFSLDPPFS